VVWKRILLIFPVVQKSRLGAGPVGRPRLAGAPNEKGEFRQKWFRRLAGFGVEPAPAAGRVCGRGGIDWRLGLGGGAVFGFPGLRLGRLGPFGPRSCTSMMGYRPNS
jgi:hypothetical protein